MLASSALERLDREPGYFIVQLVEPLTAETREELSARAGLDLDEYLPNLACVERLSREERERLAQDPVIRAVVPFSPAFELSPTIRKLRASDGGARSESKGSIPRD